jgi:LacI family transcriptional regulator
MLFHREIAEGAMQRAQSLGFGTELFWIGDRLPALSVPRLSSVLFARGIGGAVLLSFNPAQDFSAFDFSRFSVVQIDHCLVRPQLHMILPDHYISMMHALEHLTQRGYQHIGLCLDQRKDVQLKSKWSAAFMAFVRSYAQNTGIPALILPGLTRDQFLTWFRENQPDLVIGHLQIMVDWLKSIGVRVPEDVGYFNLNYTERIGPCAGLDLQPRRLGAAAVETVVGMMHRQERGVPEHPQTITLEASWVEGMTVRAEQAPKATR